MSTKPVDQDNETGLELESVNHLVVVVVELYNRDLLGRCSKQIGHLCKQLVISIYFKVLNLTLSSTSADITSASQNFRSHSIGHFSFKLASNRLRIFGF